MDTPTFNGLSIDDLRDIYAAIKVGRGSRRKAPPGLNAELGLTYRRTAGAIGAIVSTIEHPGSHSGAAVAKLTPQQRGYVRGERDTWFDAEPAPVAEPEQPEDRPATFISGTPTLIDLLAATHKTNELLARMLDAWGAGVPA